jgi:sarcosine oxidase subunit alpha
VSGPGPFRLSTGGRIDRARTLRFRCNGRDYTGCEGDTLASALLANGVRVVGRSFKFHRPRGVLSAGIEETNALFRVETQGLSVPLVRATLQPLNEGLVAQTENAWPNVHFDFGRILDFTHGLWPAGFYNKTFKWPSWHVYERFVRNSAGSGRIPDDVDPTRYFQHNLHCDVLVAGGGPAGLAAALAAGRAGAQVVIAELEPGFGGRLHADDDVIDGRPALQWVDSAVEELGRLPNVRCMASTMVAGSFDHRVFVAVDRSRMFGTREPVERLWKLRARQVVLASGSIEQPLVFTHNDRPGVMLAGAVRRYARQYAVAAGRNVLVATNNDDAYATAFALHDAGVAVPLIVDARRRVTPTVEDEARRRNLPVRQGAMVIEAVGSGGVREARVARLAADGKSIAGAPERVACDAIAMSGGWNPTVHLYSQARGTVRHDEALGCFVPSGDLVGWHVAGAAHGRFALADVLREGHEAGVAAARALGLVADAPAPGTTTSSVVGIEPRRRAPAGNTSRQWLDFRHDATVSDIELAVRENYVSVEHVKRYTTTGMSIDQGKTANLNALTLLAELTNRRVADTGTTTYRPMYSPVSMGAIAAGDGRELYSPTRRLSADAWHRAAGAVFDEYGGWQRPAYYPKAGESRDEAIAREVRTVRAQVGVLDGSPLGKIEVRGPDAAEFLHRIYLNNVHSLAPGKVRYGLMLTENGIVLDDGVFVCIAPGHYLICPTSGGAERIASWLDEWHQCEWPDLRLVISPVTTQWAVCTVSGPRARDVLESLGTDIDVSREALPHLAFAQGRWQGKPMRVQRVSFSGEMTFELSVPARSAPALFAQVARAGEAHGLAPFGVEALLVMRTEKGFIHVGVDSDGTTNPADLGFGTVVARKQGDFVGRRSLERAHDRSEDRRQLVGVEPLHAQDVLVAGAHLVETTNGRRRSAGFVTSACASPTLGRSIGLALLERGFKRKGETVTVFDARKEFPARVVQASFYDPSGERMNG